MAAAFVVGFATGRTAGGTGRAGRPVAGAGLLTACAGAALLAEPAGFGTFFSAGFTAPVDLGAIGAFRLALFADPERPAAALAVGAETFFLEAFVRERGFDFVAFPAAACFLAAGFLAGAFFEEALAGFAFLLPGFSDRDDGRLRRTGLFGAALRAAFLPGLFPFTLAIRQPFGKPRKNEWRNIAAASRFRQPYQRIFQKRVVKQPHWLVPRTV